MGNRRAGSLHPPDGGEWREDVRVPILSGDANVLVLSEHYSHDEFAQVSYATECRVCETRVAGGEAMGSAM